MSSNSPAPGGGQNLAQQPPAEARANEGRAGADASSQAVNGPPQSSADRAGRPEGQGASAQPGRAVNDVGLDDDGGDNRRQPEADVQARGDGGGGPAQPGGGAGEQEHDPDDLDAPADFRREHAQREEEKKEAEQKEREDGPQQAEEAEARRRAEERGLEDEKRAAEDKEKSKLSKTSMHFDPNKTVARQRSNLFLMNDRYIKEQDYLSPLTGDKDKIQEMKQKQLRLIGEQEKLRRGDQAQSCMKRCFGQESQLINSLEADGMYIDSATMFKNKDVNVVKLQERLLNNKQREFFEPNGEVKIDNDLLADEITRPADLAFEQTDAFQTTEKNAIISDRQNSFKNRYYRVDIIVGKVILRQCPFFSTEEQQIIDLKHLCKIYDRRVSLALIPFYKDRIEFLQKEIDEYRHEGNRKRDIAFLEAVLKNIEADLKTETAQVANMANLIYDKWVRIRDLRQDQDYTSTFYDLKVHQGNGDPAYGDDVLFNLVNRPQSGDIPKIIADNANKAKKTQAYCKLIIDGQVVAKTKIATLNWPSYEIDFLDQFQIYLFTVPNKVQVELIMNDRAVDRFDVELPGDHVRSLTSASRAIKEYEFSKKEFFLEQEAKEYTSLYREPSKPPTTDAEKKQEEKRQAGLEELNKTEIAGSAFIKAEWSGYGDKMPPARAETLFKSQRAEKNRVFHTKHQQFELLQAQRPIDVNDPRNEKVLQNIRQMKNDYLQRLLDDDAKFQLHDIDSFRSKLRKERICDPNHVNTPIPQLTSELIDGDKSRYYRDWLEQVHRKEAFKTYLQTKQDIDDKCQKELMEREGSKGKGQRAKLTDIVLDRAAIERKNWIFAKIEERRKEHNAGDMRKKNLAYETVVTDPPYLTDDSTILDWIRDCLVVQRKLKPKVRKRQAAQSDCIDSFKMYIHIVRANDVPIRLSYLDTFADFLEEKKEALDVAQYQKLQMRVFKEKQVDTFVEVRVVNTINSDDDQVLTTFACEGQQPEWNEILEFTITAADKCTFAKEELEDSPYIIYLTLFDKIVHHDYGTRGDNNRSAPYEENKYLGQIQIPLTTVLTGSKFEGSIRLERPLVLQGYMVIQEDLQLMTDESELKARQQEARPEEAIPTYLNISINLEPLVQIPRQNEKEYYLGFEEMGFLLSGNKWAKERSYPGKRKNPRSFKVFLEDIQGRSVFIPRFLTPLKPPEQVTYVQNSQGPDTKALEKCARFVSLIPYVEDSALFKDMPDITCTAQQFLDLGSGDSEEHAMLLCNYFNYIDRQQLRQPTNPNDKKGKNYNSYIVFGEAIPNGEQWFVARRDCENNFVEIWNPMNAECYNFDQTSMEIPGACGSTQTFHNNQRSLDPQCPLRKIFCFVGQESVYANIQKEDSPILLNFNLQNTKCWAAFPDKKWREVVFGGSGIVQNQQIQLPPGTKLLYTDPMPPNRVAGLEKQLRDYLTDKFMEERINVVKKTTNWLSSISEIIKATMKADEAEVERQLDAGPGNPLKDEIRHDLRRKAQGYSREVFNPAQQILSKYMSGKRQDHVGALQQGVDKVLCDFEDYMRFGRRGGTLSKMEPQVSVKSKDEDIRASMVQQYLEKIAKRCKKKVFAVPINMTLEKKLDPIWEKLKCIKAHEIDSHEVEFSLTVNIYPYPSNVFSVWVYIAVYRDLDMEDDEEYR